MKIPVVDNGGQWTHREWRVLRDLDVESDIVANTEDLSKRAIDGLVLSGGALSMESSDQPLGTVAEWIDRVEAPILGICVGHQFLARHFGGAISRNQGPEFGRIRVEVDAPDHPLFRSHPRSFNAWASHNDRVERLPPGWTGLAHSEACPIEAMAHPSRPIFGIQFHPEVEHTEGGREIFQRFVDLCRR